MNNGTPASTPGAGQPSNSPRTNNRKLPAFTALVIAMTLLAVLAVLAPAVLAQSGVPSAPLNLVGSPDTSTGILLKWDAPTTTNGALTGYVIEKNTGAMWELDIDTSTFHSGQTDTEYLDTVDEGATVSYRVKAKNANGTGAASNIVTVTAINPPLTLVSVTAQQTSVGLTFNGLIDHTSNPGKNAFTVKFGGKQVTLKRIDFPPDITRVAFNVITTPVMRPGEHVTVSYRKPSSNQLRSALGVDAPEFTDVVATNLMTPKAPSAPPNFRASPGAAAGSISLTWTEAWWNGSPIERYEVSVDDRAWTTVDGGADARNHIVPSLAIGSKHKFEVRAVNGIGNGSEASLEATVEESKLKFTLSMNVWGIRRGGDPTRATLGFTGYHRAYPLTEPITFDLTWGGNPVNEALLHPDNPTSITIPAGRVQAAVELRAAADSDGADKVYNARVHHPLVAMTPDGVFTVQNKDGKGLSVHDNEEEPVATLGAPELVEEGEDFPLTVRFGHRLDRDAAIGFGFSNPSRAKWNLTGVPSPQVITIPEGELVARTGLIRKPDNADRDTDTEITFVLNLPHRDDPWKLGKSAKTVRINDDETPDTDYRRGPWLRTGPATARESGDGTDTTMTFRVNLDDHRSNKTAVSVDYRTVDGTARAGSDYVAASGTLTFAVGDKSKDFEVTVKDDTVEDAAETFKVVLENPTGGGRIHPQKGTATGTIKNTETPVLAAEFPSILYSSSSHSGADDRPQVVVTFSEAVDSFQKDTPSVSVANGTVSSVQAHTEDGLEHAYVFFLAPSGDSDVTFTLAANHDCAGGGICTAGSVRLTEVPRARSIPGPSDDETPLPELSVNDAQASEENDATINFVVRLDPAADGAVSVEYATSDGSAKAGNDYTGTSGTLTFAPGETAKTVAIAILDDDTEENDETLTLTLSNAPNAEIKDTTATGTISDDEADEQAVETTPTLSISGGSGKEGDDDEIDFIVTLDEEASDTVTVDYATADGTADAGDDYTAKSGTLSFAAGETSKTISIAIKDDIENEGDETFTVTLSNASGAELETASATGTIRNRHVEPLTATFRNVPSSHSGSGIFTFDLTFSEDFPLSYVTLRDHAFTEDDNGPITRAQRKVQGSNQTWTITVEPSGNRAITITLPQTTDCNATGAICTDDGRKLSNSTTVTVSGSG